MSLEAKMEAMGQKYRELKSCDFPVVKGMIIEELKKLAAEAEQLMCQNEHPSNSKRRRQIEDVLHKCDIIYRELQEQTAKDIGQGGRNATNEKELKQINETQLSKIALRSVIMHEIRSSELRIKAEEYEEIYNRMCNNLEVMKEIETMVKEQGNDLDKVDKYLDSTYQNVVQVNKELDEACELQKQTRRMKFRLAVTGFFAALGYKILGLPGLILGLFTGHKATS